MTKHVVNREKRQMLCTPGKGISQKFIENQRVI